MAFPFLDILGIVGKVIDKVIPDPAEAAKLHLELAKLADAENERAHQEMMGQIDTNKAEAANPSVFVAGWRPFIGWTGGFGLAYSFLINPIFTWIAMVLFKYTGDFPQLDTGQLMTLVMGMLGFGGLRTYEKFKGVAAEGPVGNTEPLIPATIEMPKKKRFLPFDIPGIKGI